jgi:hypothetical protein
MKANRWRNITLFALPYFKIKLFFLGRAGEVRVNILRRKILKLSWVLIFIK